MPFKVYQLLSITEGQKKEGFPPTGENWGANTERVRGFEVRETKMASNMSPHAFFWCLPPSRLPMTVTTKAYQGDSRNLQYVPWAHLAGDKGHRNLNKN